MSARAQALPTRRRTGATSDLTELSKIENMKRTILVCLAVSLGMIAVGCSGDDTPQGKTTTKDQAMKEAASKPGLSLRKPNAMGGSTGGAANAAATNE